MNYDVAVVNLVTFTEIYDRKNLLNVIIGYITLAYVKNTKDIWNLIRCSDKLRQILEVLLI